MKTILHVDMDAFFASVEQRDHPEWRGKPVIVGAAPDARGVVSTCSYEARRYGVHSAMPSVQAYRLCPHAIFVRPDMERYEETSARAFETFSHYSPYVEGVSVDEAFLDISGTVHLFGSARTLGEKLREEVRRVCGVTCSVGIATNRLLAKIGSELNKPNGLAVLPTDPGETARFLAPRPVSTLWGVGKRTVEMLRPYGITTCGDLQRLEVTRLAGIVGETAAEQLREAAFGRSDDTVYWEDAAEKSVSREHTFETDETSREAVRAKLLELVEEVGVRFRTERRWARTARLKIRSAAFDTFTRQAPFSAPARDDTTFREAALQLFDRAFPPGSATIKPLRLIGFGVANLQDTPDDGAPKLFADAEDAARERRERLSDALDGLRARGLI